MNALATIAHNLALCFVLWCILPPRPSFRRWFIWFRRSPELGDPPAPVPPPAPLVVGRTDLVYTRDYDGKQTDLGCMSCPSCKNYWFVQNLPLEQPVFCCYCGYHYDGVRLVTDEEIRKQQIF